MSGEMRFEAVYHNRCSRCGTEPHSTVELVRIFTADHSEASKIAANLNALTSRLAEAERVVGKLVKGIKAILHTLDEGGHIKDGHVMFIEPPHMPEGVHCSVHDMLEIMEEAAENFLPPSGEGEACAPS